MSSETEEAQDSNGTSTMSIVLYVVRSLPSHAAKGPALCGDSKKKSPMETTAKLIFSLDFFHLTRHGRCINILFSQSVEVMGNHTESVEPHEFTEALPGENDSKNRLALYCSHTNCLRKQVAVNLLKITNKLKLKLKKAGKLNRSHTRNSRKQITVNQWKLTNKPKRKLNALPLYTTLLLQRQLLKQENDDELV
ncbi:hypothetical protein OIU77_026176 [Salix suchowensis]|uniref:Uncharacterized protein n=1 Tax=Salix suchowensis TaxID=1278906 RepID=A0ABQ9BZK1_9ROSI|nr:hypothetical protein OIU77_026176 [Salix suchowensis]